MILVPFIFMLSCRYMYLTSLSMKAYNYVPHFSIKSNNDFIFKSFYVGSISKLEWNKIHCPQDHLRDCLIAWSSGVNENNDAYQFKERSWSFQNFQKRDNYYLTFLSNKWHLTFVLTKFALLDNSTLLCSLLASKEWKRLENYDISCL